MFFSKTTGYGIRALVYLARQKESYLCGLQEIAEQEQIPAAYLGKILGDLRKHHLLRSEKGIHGGYELAQSADSITLWDVYQILDPIIDCDHCILGMNSCLDESPCALHDSWVPIRNDFVELLHTKTIAQMAEQG
ncbi:MAG: Rrf2 family transcriptional regulator [Pyrinomonadaceae bacterium]